MFQSRRVAWPLALIIVSAAGFGAIAQNHPERVARLAVDAMVWTSEGSPTLEQRRKKLKDAAAAQEVRLTPLAFIIKAVVIALKEFPIFNTSMAESGDKLVWKQYFNVGFAADTPNGLVVPVIAEADLKDVMSLAKELGELSAKAREGKIAAKEMQGGTFTVSSLGGIGGTHFTPIINAPEVAILGVGRADFRPVWQDEDFVPRLILPLSLSYDHRVIDGATGVRFTTFLRDVLADADRVLLGS